MAYSLNEVTLPMMKKQGSRHVLITPVSKIQTTQPEIAPVFADFMFSPLIADLRSYNTTNPQKKNRMLVIGLEAE